MACVKGKVETEFNPKKSFHLKSTLIYPLRAKHSEKKGGINDENILDLSKVIDGCFKCLIFLRNKKLKSIG